MMNSIDRIILPNGYTIQVYHDPDAEAPEQDRSIYIHTSNNRYFAPPMPSRPVAPNECDTFPVYAFIHGSIAFSLESFSCPFDSGQIGRLFVARSEAFGDVTTEQIAAAKISEWNSYLSGERYGYQLFAPDDENECDSCWGFDDKGYMIREATIAATHHAFEALAEDSKIARMMAL